jgi:thiol-disulfide isomerase/thioredoxin
MNFEDTIDYTKKYLKYKKKYMEFKIMIDNLNKNEMIMNGGGNKDNELTGKTLALFKAEWCGHCNNFKSTWNELKNNDANKNINFVTYDSEKNKNEIKNYNIQGFPTLVLLTGEKAIEYVGPRDKNSITEFINQYN